MAPTKTVVFPTSPLALLLSTPALAASEITDAVSNQQVAPTILVALGLDPMALQAVKSEGVKVLPVAGLTQLVFNKSGKGRLQDGLF